MKDLNMSKDLQTRADSFTEEHFDSPTPADYLLIRLAMSIGAHIALEQFNKIHSDAHMPIPMIPPTSLLANPNNNINGA